MEKGPEGFSWLLVMMYAAFASFGGAMGHVMRSVHNNTKITVWRVMLEAGGAAFVGIMVMFLCQAMNMSPQWTGVVVGVCGWMGATASIGLLEKVVYRKLGVAKDEQAQ